MAVLHPQMPHSHITCGSHNGPSPNNIVLSCPALNSSPDPHHMPNKLKTYLMQGFFPLPTPSYGGFVPSNP